MNNNFTNTSETDNKKDNKFFSFIKKNIAKFIVGIAAVVVTAFVINNTDITVQIQTLLLKYKDTPDDDYESNSFTEYYCDSFFEEDGISSIDNKIDLTAEIERQTIEVRQFIRRMSDNCYASDEKIAEAEKLGITLNEHETIVDPHTREIAA